MANPTAGKAKNQQGIVFAFRLLVMHQGVAPSHDLDHGIFFSEEITCCFYAMTTESVHSAAPSFCHVPEVSAVGPTMRLSGADPKDSSNPSSLDHRSEERRVGKECRTRCWA